MSSPFKPSSMDWPLSRDEKKARVMQCYDNEVRATQQLLNSTANGNPQVEAARFAKNESFLPSPCPEPRSQGGHNSRFGSPAAPELELPCPSTPDSLRPKIRVSDASSEPDKLLHAVPQGIDPAVWRRAIEAALSTIVASGGARAEAPVTPPGRAQQETGADKRRTRSEPRHCFEEPVTRRYSRGSREGKDIPKVTFKDGKRAGEDDSSSDDQSHTRECMGKVGVIASRRRLSRGPDGAPVRISAKPVDDDNDSTGFESDGSDAADEEKEASDAGYVKAATAAGAVAGGAGGFMSGGAIGAAVGLGGALFTFGLSIPIGAAVGSGAGLLTGTAVGGTAAYKISASNSQPKRTSDRSLSRGRK